MTVAEWIKLNRSGNTAIAVELYTNGDWTKKIYQFDYYYGSNMDKIVERLKTDNMNKDIDSVLLFEGDCYTVAMMVK